MASTSLAPPMDPNLDATAQADLVRAGEVSPRELAEASIERIEALNGELNAVIHPLFEQALETEPADGPFRGVPFVVKDLICSVAGAPQHEGMRFLRDLGFRADADSWLAERFPNRRWPDRVFPPVGIFDSTLKSFLLLSAFTVLDTALLRLRGRTGSIAIELRKPGEARARA